MHWWTVQQLRSKKPLTRMQAVAKLAAEGSARALELLDQVLAADPEANVRKSALQAAATCRQAGGLEVISKGLRDPDEGVRELAARLLGQSGDRRALDELLKALDDPAGPVRRQAAIALDALGWQPDSDTLRLRRAVALGEFHKVTSQGAAAVEPLIAALKDPQNPNRRLALEALSQTGDARALKPIIGALTDADPHLRVAAIEALARMREASATDALLPCLRDRACTVRAAAAAALGRIGATKAVAMLVPSLKDEHWSVRQAAAEALGQLRAEAAVGPLLPLLKDRDKDVRLAAVQALAALGDRQAVQALVETLADVQSEVRRAAAAALEKIEPDWPRTEAARQAMPALRAAQQHAEYWVRQAATEALARITARPAAPAEPEGLSDTMRFRRKTAVEMLAELLGDFDRDLRLAAAEALGRLGDPRGLPPLIASLQDEDPWVREASIGALNRLGWSPGDPLPALPDAAPGTARPPHR